jgi:hypothetical protein
VGNEWTRSRREQLIRALAWSHGDALQCARQFELPLLNRDIDCIRATTIDSLIGESTRTSTMTQTYSQLVKKIAALQQKAASARAREIAGVVDRIK